MPLTGALVFDGMEVGEEYTYVRLIGDETSEVHCKLLSVQPDGTGTVEVLATREVPEQDLVAWLATQRYTHAEAADVMARLRVHPDLWFALVTLATVDREPSDLVAADVSYTELRRKHWWMPPVNALLTLAWLREDPQAARQALAAGIR